MRLARVDLRDDAPAGLAILDHSSAKREECVIPTDADVATRMDPRTELAHEDRAGRHGLASEDFDSASLSLAVATVS